MSTSFKRNVIFVITVMITAMACIILPLISYINPAVLNNVKIEGAMADVRDFNITEGESVSLAGEWEFYWKKHIVSDNVKNLRPDLIVNVPYSWTTYEIDGEQLPNGGFASYRIRVKNINTVQPVLVSVQNLPGKCEVFIDGEFVFSNRSVPNGTNADKSVVEPYAKPLVLDETKYAHEVVVEVECDFSSGLTTLPVLSNYNEYQNDFMTSVALRFILIGVVAFFAVGTLVLALRRRDMTDHLWLILLCVVFIFRMLISNEGYTVAHNIFGNMNYEIMMSLIFVSTYIIKLCMLMHLINVLDIKISNVTISFISFLFLLCAFVPYFTYDYIYVAKAYMWIQSVAYAFDVYMMYKLTGGVVKKQGFAILYLVFYCITAAALVTDNLYLYGYISNSVSFVMPLACFLFIALMLIVHISNTLNDYQKARKTAELEKELSELNMMLMLSQIQPHFLYNALNTIKYLIKKDPKTAESVVVKFSGYLRTNMDSLTQKEPTPFEKELEHVENYVSIEQIRFGDRLNVEYDINTTDFSIPPLTIQPIVENAIKHGVNQKAEGGTVKIKSYQSGSYNVVCVEDDGVGFDVNEEKNDGRSHVGVTNIKKRLEVMLDAFIEIKSEINKGTKVTIKIPKKEGDNENNCS